MKCAGCGHELTTHRTYAGGLECLHCHKVNSAHQVIATNLTGAKDPKKWAKDLLARHKRGEDISLLQLAFAREAMRAD